MQHQFITALGSDAYDERDAGRRQRGLAIAALVPIEKQKSGYRVPSQSHRGFYVVNLEGDDGPTCTCAGFRPVLSYPDREQWRPCKHIYAVWMALQRETLRRRGPGQEDGGQRAAEKGQESELRRFEALLRVLCDRIEQACRAGQGRPSLTVSDIAFCAVYKQRQHLSRRGFTADIERMQDVGLVDQVPSDSAISRFLNHTSTTSLLKRLVMISASPLASVEAGFAIDGSGFETQNYRRVYNKKRGREERCAEVVRAHVLCGIKTRTAVAAEVSENQQHDSPLFPMLLRTMAGNFDVQELYGDTEYLSGSRFTFMDQGGVRFVIPFRVNTAPTDGNDAWSKACRFFAYKSDEFRAHYGQRSQPETAFHMDGSCTDPAVRSKNLTAQFNEALCKLVHHNVHCLINETCELGIESELEKWVAEALDRYDQKLRFGQAVWVTAKDNL